MFNSKFLAEGVQSSFVTEVLPIFKIIFICLIFVAAVILIVAALLQSNENSGDINAISGSQESYYGQNKGSTRDSKLKKTIIACASIIAGLILVVLILALIYPGI